MAFRVWGWMCSARVWKASAGSFSSTAAGSGSAGSRLLMAVRMSGLGMGDEAVAVVAVDDQRSSSDGNRRRGSAAIHINIKTYIKRKKLLTAPGESTHHKTAEDGA